MLTSRVSVNIFIRVSQGGTFISFAKLFLDHVNVGTVTEILNNEAHLCPTRHQMIFK